jgi:magnesium chelatase family protein
MYLTFPASVMLAGAMNPRLPGFWNDPTPECCCSPAQIELNVARISRLLLDHIIIPVVFAITALQTFIFVPKALARVVEHG